MTNDTSKPGKTMTAKDRDALNSAINARAKVARVDVDRRAAHQLAQVEARLAAQFSAEDEQFNEATRLAKAAICEADEMLSRICADKGIPDSFRPRLTANWYGRGENADPKRRAELRRMAEARVEAMKMDGYHAIEAWRAEAQIRLLSGALDSGEAKAFLAAMPSADTLLPSFTPAQLDALAPPLRAVQRFDVDEDAA